MAGDLQVTLVKMQRGAPPPPTHPKLMNLFGFLPTWQDSFTFTQRLLCLGVSTLRNGHADFWLSVEDPEG